MTVTLTATADLGPGLTETAQVYNDVRFLNFDFTRESVTVIYGDALTTKEFSYTEIATVTWTISGTTTTITVST